MRVLLLSEYSGIGGGEAFIINVAQGLRSQGHDVAVGVPGPGRLGDECGKLGVPTITWRPTLVGIVQLGLYVLRTQVERCIFNGPSVLYRMAPATFFRPALRRVLVCHGTWLSLAFPRRALLNIFARKILVPNDHVKKYILHRGGPKRVEVIDLPIFVDNFAFNASNRLNSAPNYKKTVGMLARFQEVKGQDIFIRAINQLRDIWDQVEFVVGGGNPFHRQDASQFTEYVYALCEQLNVQGKVGFVGEVEDTAKYLAAIDILVVPSRYESYGMVVLEGMASGCLVIASATDGPRKLISHGRDGYLFDIEDHIALAKLIRQSIHDTEKTEEMVRRAFQMVRGQYDSRTYDWSVLL